MSKSTPLSILINWLANLPDHNKNHLLPLLIHQGHLMWPACDLRTPPDRFLAHITALVDGASEDQSAGVAVALRGQVDLLLYELTPELAKRRLQQMRGAGMELSGTPAEQDRNAESWGPVQDSWRTVRQAVSDSTLDAWIKQGFIERNSRRG